MVRGIIIFESGGVQQIGDISSLQGIINTIKQILPELEAKESSRVLDTISDEDLKRIIAAREAATGKTEKL
jgi:hypothetical protein